MNKPPNFLIIGERRSGTTTLAQWLKGHPEIFLHPKMDIGYFVDDELVGAKEDTVGSIDYKNWNANHHQSAYESMFSDANNQKAIGEKSADYLFLTQCHPRIKNWYPDVKLLVTLRNPADRAWSMYWNEVGKGRESLSFEAALAAESERIERSDYARDHLSYFHRGLYAQSLQHLFTTFPKEQVKVVILEEFMKTPQRTIKDIYHFLGVDPNFNDPLVGQRFNRNWTTTPKAWVQQSGFWLKMDRASQQLMAKISRLVYRNDTYARRRFQVKLSGLFREQKATGKIPDPIRRMLRKQYQADHQALEGLLGQKISWW